VIPCMTTAFMALICATTHPKMQVDRPCSAWAVCAILSGLQGPYRPGRAQKFSLIFSL